MSNETNEKVVIHFELDVKAIREHIGASLDLESDEAVFQGLSQVQEVKDAFKANEAILKEIESDVKAAINDKAKNLYGESWKAIKGEKFKISRSKTGSVYEVIDEEAAPAEMVKIEVKPDTDAIDEFVKVNETLPPGIGANPNRGDQLRITVKS